MMAQRTRVQWNGAAITAAVQKAAERGVQLAAEHLLQKSRELVPIEEGTLERSGTVTREGTRAAVSYDGPYATRQHEELLWRHDDGRQAKYLEQPARDEAPEMQNIMAAQIRRALP